MRKFLKQHWNEFKQGKPGRRFQERFERRKHLRHTRPWYITALQILLAVIFVLVGIVFAFIPGPAVLFYAIAAVILADQSLALARSLDWIEVKLRTLLAWTKAWWQKTSVQGAIVLLGIAGSAAGGA